MPQQDPEKDSRTAEGALFRRWGWGSFQLQLPPLLTGAELIKSWWDHLAGVIDGDGCWSSKGLAIAGHWEEEPGLLWWIWRLLWGFGNVTHSRHPSKPKGKGASYTLTDPVLLRWVLLNCGGSLQNPARRAQAAMLAETLGITLPPQQAPTYAWALGLFETDGYLNLAPSGKSYNLRLRVEVTEEALTRALQFLFGGSVR